MTFSLRTLTLQAEAKEDVSSLFHQQGRSMCRKHLGVCGPGVFEQPSSHSVPQKAEVTEIQKTTLNLQWAGVKGLLGFKTAEEAQLGLRSL